MLNGRLFWLLVVVAMIGGTGYAAWQAWVCDDAFISYRYARHLADGHGLVFNRGAEAPVEGYSNFLWTVLLAGGMALGAEAVVLSQALGCLFYAATIVVLGVVAWRQRDELGAAAPVAALGFAAFHHGAIFATGGLETMMFTFLVTTGLVCLIGARSAVSFLAAGMLLILAAMTRPDGALFYGFAGLVVFAYGVTARRLAPVVAFAVPLVAVFVPFFLLKWSYYGYPFPNTAYAKSASKPYFEQGLFYVFIFFRHYLILAPLLLLPLVLVARNSRAGLASGLHTLRAPLLIGMFVLGYLGYVSWVGGDFMFGRFCMPVVPALLLGLQLFVASRLRMIQWMMTSLVVGGLVAAAVLIHAGALQKKGYRQARHIGDSPALYQPWVVDGMRKVGLQLKQHLRQAAPVVAITGGEAMLAYYMDLPVVIERYGLTDAYIAHRPISKRGKIGHEKGIGVHDTYLVDQRKVSLVFGSGFLTYNPELVHPSERIGPRRHIEFYVKGIRADEPAEGWWAKGALLTWRNEVMDTLLKEKGVRCVDFRSYLDEYLGSASSRSKEELVADYAAFCRFYFDHNTDVARRNRFQTLLAR